jgi:serine/threonine protein kinase
MARGIPWDDVRPFEKPISVRSFTPIDELPNCVIEFETETVIPVTLTVPVPEFGSSAASVHWRRGKPMRMVLHPDVITVAHLSEFEVDMSSLREVRTLGFGGSGKVKLMVNKSSYKFAVKYCSLPHGTRRFRREIESMCRLNHPCVIPCYGFSLRSESYGRREGIIVMKYAKNGSLGDVLNSVRAGKRPPFWTDTGIAIIVCGIISGIEFIHSQGIVHRDIKPANILLDGRFHSLIGDFGSSKMISAGCRASHEVTTHLYEAPELLNQSEYTNKVGVFSFAVVLYEILGGTLDDSPKFVLEVMKGARAAFPDWINDNMKSLISRCWAEDPDDRPSFTEIMSELKRIEFKILPDVDCVSVKEFLSDVESKRASIFLNCWDTRKTGAIFKRAIKGSISAHPGPESISDTRIGPVPSFQ